MFKEAGGHRWQRVAPNDRRGRVHTSTVTVAVLEPLTEDKWTIPDNEIEVIVTKDSGAGGQHRNKTESCIVLVHRPTGIRAKSAQKSQLRNRVLAREMLEARVKDERNRHSKHSLSDQRKRQVGSGMRADKIRTYRTKDNKVVDGVTGCKYSLKKIMKGNLELFDK